MRRILIITIILVIALVALLLGLNFNRRQIRFDAIQQNLLSQCNNATCRAAIQSNFSRCIKRYGDEYSDNIQQHPAGILTCMDIPSSDYTSFSIIDPNAPVSSEAPVNFGSDFASDFTTNSSDLPSNTSNNTTNNGFNSRFGRVSDSVNETDPYIPGNRPVIFEP